MTTLPESSARTRIDTAISAPPTTYAAPEAVADYLTAMSRRARLQHSARPPLYLSAAPRIRPHLNIGRLAHLVSPCRVLDFDTAFPTRPDHSSAEQYAARWPDLADDLSGLLVGIGKSGLVGKVMLREIADAEARSVPVVVLRASPTSTSLVPMLDCRLDPLDANAPPWLGGTIHLPAKQSNRITLSAALRAMGVRQGGGQG